MPLSFLSLTVPNIPFLSYTACLALSFSPCSNFHCLLSYTCTIPYHTFSVLYTGLDSLGLFISSFTVSPFLWRYYFLTFHSLCFRLHTRARTFAHIHIVCLSIYTFEPHSTLLHVSTPVFTTLCAHPYYNHHSSDRPPPFGATPSLGGWLTASHPICRCHWLVDTITIASLLLSQQLHWY